MTASEMRAALQPKAMQLQAREEGHLAAFYCGLGAQRRSEVAWLRAKAVQADLTEEAQKLGIAAGFFASLVLKWVISQLRNEIMKRWFNDNRSNPAT